MKRLNIALIMSAIIFCAISPSIFRVGANPLQAQDQSSAPQAVTAIQLDPILTGLSNPVYVTNAHDGSDRLFVVERGGIIKIRQPGASTTLPTPFLDVSTIIISGGEQGLLGLAFHPQYATNRRFFVNYTRIGDGATVIAEYKVSAGNPNVAETTGIPILTIPQPFANHNGGMIEFGPDGFLYIAMGDGGDGNDPGNRAQNINELLGKMLRINIDIPNGQIPYSSPPTNPFFGATPGLDEIFAIGLRNPWRFSFERGTGQIYLGDVGQGAREEIDLIINGGNYGWRIMEGSICNPNFNGGVCTPPTGHIPPIGEYINGATTCAITGGYAYRGTRETFPAGKYIFADFCSGEIFQLDGSTPTLVLDAPINISSFGEDEAGEIYVVGLGGSVQKISSTTPLCSNSIAPTNLTFAAMGGSGTVNVTASGSCNWSAISNNSSFITVTSGASGTGNGSVGFTVASNPNTRARTGAISIAGQLFTIRQAGNPTLFNFDGDLESDLSTWTPSTGFWHINNSATAQNTDFLWGITGDEIAPGDYDGDGNTDIAIWRPSTGVWFIVNSIDDSVTTRGWGVNGDVPVPADYDSDGRADLAIWRPSTGVWFIINSSNGSVTAQSWGVNGDVPVPGDYDEDGRADLAIWRPSTGVWFIINSSNGSVTTQGWGVNGDVPVPGDYDDDGKTDVAVWRPSNGTWYIINSSNSSVTTQGWGVNGDVAVPGDYDGDGKTDLAVWRPVPDAIWHIINSSNSSITSGGFGTNGDVPVPSAPGQ
jgi:glucose/arabinose dehydrogenase